MKIYVITEGLENNIRCAFVDDEIAELILESFPHLALSIKKVDLMDFESERLLRALSAPASNCHVEIKNISIEKLGLLRRTELCLIAENILTIGQLLRFDEMQIIRMPNMGRKCLNDITNALASHGLSLRKGS